MNRGLADVHAAIAASEHALARARAELDAADADARRLGHERAVLERAVEAADGRVRSYEAARKATERSLSWDDEDLRDRVQRAQSESEAARALVGEALAVQHRAEVSAKTAARCRELLLEEAAASPLRCAP